MALFFLTPLSLLHAMLELHGAGAPITGGSTMSTQSRRPLAGFGWLKNGISLGFRHPKSIFGGAAFLVLALLLPSLPTLLIQFHLLGAGTPQSPAILLWLMPIGALFGLLIVPLYAGYLQVIDAAEHGLPARARDIFKPYRQGEALRLIGYGLALIAIYIVMLGIIIAAAGRGIASWYMQVLTAQVNHQPPPGLPQGFGIAMALLTVLGLFMVGLYSVSLGQVALRRRGVFGAIGDGLAGALKNLLPLLVLAVSVVLAWIVVVIALAIVVGLLALIGHFVGAWLMLVLIIPVYIALVLVTFAVMFGVMYYLWRDVCGDDTAHGVDQAIAA
ncbi:MAG: hypothetical protein ACREPZ_12005 [Rhodanobacteraceae bacterium]